MPIKQPGRTAEGSTRAPICTTAQFEAALERAARLLQEQPPEGYVEGSAAHTELFQLLAAIAAYAPAHQAETPKAPLADLERAAGQLLAKAEDFRKARDARVRSERLTSFPEDGQGLGPTTGV